MQKQLQQKTKSPQLRPLAPPDAEALRKLYAHSLQKNPRGFVQSPGFHGDIFLRIENYQKENGLALGLFVDDKDLIGFGGLKKKTDDRVELCNLHLHPASQGQGFGKHMSVTLIEQARALGYKTIELHVTATQDKAIGLYKRLGFIETKRQVYDVEGQTFDTVFMELPL